MKYNGFDELGEEYYKLEEDEKYEEALNILEKGLEIIPREEVEKNLFTFMLDKCWFAYNCAKYETVLDTLKYMVEKGFPCPLYWFDSLSNLEGYKELKEKNDLLLIEAQRKAKLQYIVYVPKDYTKEKKYPVFFNLHGDGDNLEYHKKYWKPENLLNKGFIVVYLQSSQVLRHNSYGWIKNHIIAKLYSTEISSNLRETYDNLYEEIKTCYDSVSKQYSIDEENVIIGGFSGGAIGSVDITLANIIPIKGVIALCCSQKTKRFTEENIRAAHERGVRWVFIDGKEDIPVEALEETINTFKKLGVPYEYYINDGIGHWYPKDLDFKVENALNFIMES
jgi:predicted esterase